MSVTAVDDFAGMSGEDHTSIAVYLVVRHAADEAVAQAVKRQRREPVTVTRLLGTLGRRYSCWSHYVAAEQRTEPRR